MTPGTLGGVMVSTLVKSARNIGSVPALDTIFPMFNTLLPCRRKPHELALNHGKYSV